MKFRLVEQFVSNDIVPGTAGYVLPDGSMFVLDEYHGENSEHKGKGYPEFSNTHAEEDTCIRVYDTPNKAQYDTLEEIIDFYLQEQGYCKIEIWTSNHSYSFYEIYSLWEGACEDTSSWKEHVGNWTGWDLIKVIKANV